jgi:hypothetical protein
MSCRGWSHRLRVVESVLVVRTYGRVYSVPPSDVSPGVYGWVVVETEPNGSNDYVYLTTLIQCLKLQTNESPFYANYGIPAQRSIMQQIAPDFDVMKTQAQFAPYFASLIISRRPGSAGSPPTYLVNVMLNNGTKIATEVGT